MHRYRIRASCGRWAEAWRVAKDRYVATSGITGVLVVDRVGPLPHDVPDSRGRYDTIGRTVYVADRPATAMAEVLQPFRAQSLATAKDADAIGSTWIAIGSSWPRTYTSGDCRHPARSWPRGNWPVAYTGCVYRVRAGG